jgi:hypothetical protein
VLSAFGIGFDLGLAAGIIVTTNCGINQFLGLIYAGLLGGFAANMAGLYIAEHSPFLSNVGQGAEAGGVRGSRKNERGVAGVGWLVGWRCEGSSGVSCGCGGGGVFSELNLYVINPVVA